MYRKKKLSSTKRKVILLNKRECDVYACEQRGLENDMKIRTTTRACIEGFLATIEYNVW